MDNLENLREQLDAYLAENFFEEDFVAEFEEIFTTKAKEDLDADEEFFASKPLAAAAPPKYSFCAKINFDKIFEKNESETFSEMMTRLVKESGEKNSAVYNRAQIDRQLFSRIKRNKDYQPSKDTAVALALGLKLDFDKAKDFLAAAGYTLTKSKRDLIISFFIENKIFDTALLNDYLYEYKQPILLGK